MRILRSWEGVKEEAPAPFCVSGSTQNEGDTPGLPTKAHRLRSRGVSTEKRFLLPLGYS